MRRARPNDADRPSIGDKLGPYWAQRASSRAASFRGAAANLPTSADSDAAFGSASAPASSFATSASGPERPTVVDDRRDALSGVRRGSTSALGRLGQSIGLTNDWGTGGQPVRATIRMSLPSKEDRVNAVGSLELMNQRLRLCYDGDQLVFTPLYQPNDEDWLAQRAEPGQSFPEWRSLAKKRLPSGSNRCKIYYTIVGDGLPEQLAHMVGTAAVAFFSNVCITKLSPVAAKSHWAARRRDVEGGERGGQSGRDGWGGGSTGGRGAGRGANGGSGDGRRRGGSGGSGGGGKEAEEGEEGEEGDDDSTLACLSVAKVLSQLERVLPPDGYCVLGLTMHPVEGVVCSAMDKERRTGIFSFHRYIHESLQQQQYPSPDSGGPGLSPASRQRQQIMRNVVLVRRACRTFIHELLHLFGLQHCIFFKCLMNGCKVEDEIAIAALTLCPVCLRKLHTAMGVLTSSRVLERYRALHTFYGSNKLFFGQEAEWIGERVRTIDRIP
jgi:hypothetical protein